MFGRLSSVVQLGDPYPWYIQGGPAKVGASMSFLFTKGSLVVKIKNTCSFCNSVFQLILNLDNIFPLKFDVYHLLRPIL